MELIVYWVERELDFTRLLICTSLTNTSLHDRPPRTIAYNAMSKFLISRKRFLKFAYEYFLRSFIYCTEIEFFDNTIFPEYGYTRSSIIM